jgi:ribosomal protein S27E
MPRARKVIDETGKRYGRLTVISRADNGKWSQARWHCRCDCENTTVVNGSALRGGTSTSCGCFHAERVSGATLINLTGMDINGWRVIRRVDPDLYKNDPHWQVRCTVCGLEKTYAGGSLRSGVFPCNCERMLGRTFGARKIISRDGQSIDNWVTECQSCGTVRVYPGRTVRHVRSLTCKACPVENKTNEGDIYRNWRVLRRDSEPRAGRNVYWLVRCVDCGTELDRAVSGTVLRQGKWLPVCWTCRKKAEPDAS